MFNCPGRHTPSAFQRFGFSTSAPQQDDKEVAKPTYDGGNKTAAADAAASSEADNVPGTEKAQDAGSQDSVSQSNIRRRATKRTAFSDSDSEDLDLSKEDLVKLLLEKDESLNSKDLEIKDMNDKVLRSYAEMENVLARTKRESENTKKYAIQVHVYLLPFCCGFIPFFSVLRFILIDTLFIQSFSKSLLDVADNLSRASSVVKESFSKIDTSNSSDEAVPLLKTLLEGVEMTEKQLGEVFRVSFLASIIVIVNCCLCYLFFEYQYTMRNVTFSCRPLSHYFSGMHANNLAVVHLTLICNVQVFKKFGVEKFDPLNEKFDPNRHYALFQIPDLSKPSGTVAAIVKVCILNLIISFFLCLLIIYCCDSVVELALPGSSYKIFYGNKILVLYLWIKFACVMHMLGLRKLVTVKLLKLEYTHILKRGVIYIIGI
jgi:molecular chaperone GrpE (heat shock protein)